MFSLFLSLVKKVSVTGLHSTVFIINSISYEHYIKFDVSIVYVA